MNRTLLGLIALTVFWSCSSSKQLVKNDPVEVRQLDTLVISATDPIREEQAKEEVVELPDELPTYHRTYRRTADLLHTKLDVRFDYQNEAVIGVADLTLKPLFYPIDQIILDAKGFQINQITMMGRPLTYDYKDDKLTIHLGRKFTRDQTIDLQIDYKAFPGKGTEGGSAAITSDKGLFFINPRGEDPDKPTQIWTQGETESNSRWFPTIDKPVERCTQEMYITVDDKYVTLSNGLLISSKKNADGTRTDYWKMDKPHAPYLFMMAIGDFAVVKDKWRGKELGYYVEPAYQSVAKDIFEYTPEMLSFFSELLGVDYPWDKYSQVVVRDYVSGAMENTSAVIFGEFVQKTKRELIDRSNERIVAHEMFHHWFGDLVTCESWSNLTLNEGFANYSEYLWFEHKHGRDAADHHRMNEQNGYIGSTMQGGIHPLIHFGYGDKEEMFDAHSYNKGGLVLHQLRNVLGDEAFFAGLKKYLQDNAYTDVEAHELRLAMEDVSGQDLNWFFNQWFFAAGHPSVQVSKHYDAAQQTLRIDIEQTQPADHGQPYIFQVPMAIDIYQDGQDVRRESIMLNRRNQSWTFKVEQKPKLVNVDADRVFIGNKVYNQSPEEYAYQYAHAPLFEDRYEAIKHLSISDSPVAAKVLKSALKDPFWSIRQDALKVVDLTDEALVQPVMKMATMDPHSNVRKAAIQALTAADKMTTGMAENIINAEQAYPVVAEALMSLNTLDSLKALSYAKKFDRQKIKAFSSVIAGIYAKTGSQEYIPFFRNKLEEIAGFGLFNFSTIYTDYISRLDDDKMSEEIGFVHTLANKNKMWKKLALFKTLTDIRNALMGRAETDPVLLKVTSALDDIQKNETNPRLIKFYGQFGNRS